MSKSAEKFDKLPQEFDKEAIWNGIEKPTAGGFPFSKNLWWAAAIMAASLVSFFATKHLNNNNLIAESKTQASENLSPQAPRLDHSETSASLLNPKLEQTTGIIHSNSKTRASLPPKKVDSESLEKLSERNIVQARKGNLNREKNTLIIDPQQKKENKKNKSQSTLNYKLDLDKNKIKNQELIPLPLVNISPKTTQKELNISIRKIEPIKNNFAKNNLILRTGIGIHQSSFSSSDGAEAPLRTQLEKAQMDYSLGMIYERMLNRNYFISLSLDYSLFKEEIATTYVDESLDLPLKYNYELHNHYHVISCEVGLGRRFFLKGCFIDMNGGAGLKFYQTVEADYFVNPGQLAPKNQINDDYRNNSNFYFTGKAAFGKYLTNRIFMRSGAQMRSKIQLSASSAETEHHVTPTHFFVELGMRF